MIPKKIKCGRRIKNWYGEKASKINYTRFKKKEGKMIPGGDFGKWRGSEFAAGTTGNQHREGDVGECRDGGAR